jgi:hypothetical protein
VVRALQEVCMGTDLAVCGPSGISGGSVAGDDVEAYVVIDEPGVYQVELWTHRGVDAYRIVRFAALDDAVRCAVEATKGTGTWTSEAPGPSR